MIEFANNVTFTPHEDDDFSQENFYNVVNYWKWKVFYGRGGEARTPNTRFWRPVLYQLNYAPIGINKLWYELAEWTGLEPATPCVTGRYSNQLNYHSAKNDDWQCLTLTWGNPTLPSALQHFTSEFGMVSGGSIALSLPKIFYFFNLLNE